MEEEEEEEEEEEQEQEEEEEKAAESVKGLLLIRKILAKLHFSKFCLFVRTLLGGGGKWCGVL